MLANLPAGITPNPASPFTVAAGANTSVVFGATVTAAPGSSTITAQAVSARCRIPLRSPSPFKLQYSRPFRAPPTSEPIPLPRPTILPVNRTIATSRTTPPTNIYSSPTAP